MQEERRRFIKLGLAGAAGLLSSCGRTGSDPTPVSADAAMDRSLEGPVVLSTWKHGVVANAKAWSVLQAKGSILDAVESGVAVVESGLRNRSVGLGGAPDRDGIVTLDACIQDHRGKAGAVAFISRYENPIRIARAIMERTPHLMLVGAGAERWASENGFARRDVDIPEVREAWLEWLEKGEYVPVANIENHDTIGMIGRDSNGQLAGSCTTSGMAYKIHGRVGDSPIIGAGLFVDGDIGAACSTGVGELVIQTAGSHTVVELMRHGRSPEEACKEAVARIIKQDPELIGSQVGFLALRADGAYGAWSIYEGFNYACTTDSGAFLVDSGFERRWS